MKASWISVRALLEAAELAGVERERMRETAGIDVADTQDAYGWIEGDPPGTRAGVHRSQKVAHVRSLEGTADPVHSAGSHERVTLSAHRKGHQGSTEDSLRFRDNCVEKLRTARGLRAAGRL